MTTPVKVALGILGAFVLVIVALVGFDALRGEDPVGAAATVEEAESRLVRDNSHVLGEPGESDVTFVEFLDFECEGCRAAYPAIEQLRQDYAGQVTFVVRYFPMPGHFNAERAARSVEAAAQQGRFEDMYKLMYETQAEWGEQRVPLDEEFRTFAQDLGLDMYAYDRVYEDPDTAERIKADQADGVALDVQGTPTFFVNGKQLQPRTYEDLTGALDDALNS